VGDRSFRLGDHGRYPTKKIMYASQFPWYELFQGLHEYEGHDAFADVLAPWASRNEAVTKWIPSFRDRTNDDWNAATDEDLCLLYAIFRVTSVLLLGFQNGRADGTDWLGPKISTSGFQRFHELIGFQTCDQLAYHPFFHEIVDVKQTSNEGDQIQLVDLHWPAIKLGGLMFCRAGVSVTAGKQFVDKSVVESSQLYWTYRRKDRPCNDQSHGWGHNSQWRTRLRRDYAVNGSYNYNVDGDQSLNQISSDLVDEIPIAAMIELVRNRSLITHQLNDCDLYPYVYSIVDGG